MGGLAAIINNKLPKHNEVVTDNRKSIMLGNTPVIYGYSSHPHTAGFNARLKTTFKDQVVRVHEPPLWRTRPSTKFSFKV